MVGIPEGGIFQVQRAPDCDCGTQGRQLHLGVPFFKSGERLDAAAAFSVRHFFKLAGSLVAAEPKGRHLF